MKLKHFIVLIVFPGLKTVSSAIAIRDNSKSREKVTEQPNTALKLQIHCSFLRYMHYLLLLNYVDSSFDIRKSMHCGQNGLPLILFTQLSSWTSILRKRGGIHKSSKIKVFLKVGYSVFHLIVIKVWFHKSNLYIGLGKR